MIIIQNELLHDKNDRRIDSRNLQEFVIMSTIFKLIITVSLCSITFYKDDIISFKEFALYFYVFLLTASKMIKHTIYGYPCIITRNFLIFYLSTANDFEEIQII